MKKTLLCRRIFAAVLLLTVSTISWANGTKINNIYYLLDSSTTTASVTYTGTTSDYNPSSTAYTGSITIPSTVTYNSITYSVTSIGSSAFEGCTGLTSVTIPNSVTSIGSFTFRKCSGLTSITIPNSVTSMGNYAFYQCSGLTSVIIGNNVTSIGSDVFSGCTGLTSVSIPNSVTFIGIYAFSGCSSLTSITIPNSVTIIGWSAFSGCSGLKEVYCMAEQVPSTKTNAFSNTDIASATLYVPASAIDTYKATAPWSGFGTILPIPLLGDANGNGEVEIGDVTSVLTLMATPEATGYDNKAADANGNGEIEIGDVTTILTIMANGE